VRGLLRTTLHLGVLVVAFGALTAHASASGYSELNAGIAAHNRGEVDAIVKHLTLALAAPDLPARFVPIARYDRSEAYWAREDYHNAALDLDAALALRHDWYDALELRGEVRGKLGDNSGAEADFAAAIAVRADLVDAYLERSRLFASEGRYQDAVDDDTRASNAEPNLSGPIAERAQMRELAGQFDQALSDFSKARELTGDRHAYAFQTGIVQWALGKPDDAVDEFDDVPDDGAIHMYGELWTVIAKKFNAKALAALGKSVASADLTKWPGPIVSFYLGGITDDQLNLAAEHKSKEITLGRRCEADFYAAEFQLSRNDSNGAASMLKAASSECPIDFVERPVAALEFSRLEPGVAHEGK
jgi:lipoprotein NlpI